MVLFGRSAHSKLRQALSAAQGTHTSLCLQLRSPWVSVEINMQPTEVGFVFFFFCRVHRLESWVSLNALRCPSATQNSGFLSLGLVEMQCQSETEVAWLHHEYFYPPEAIWPPLLSKVSSEEQHPGYTQHV